MVPRPCEHRLPHRFRYQLLQRAVQPGARLVEVRSTPTTIEIFYKGQRVASHLRARGHGHTVTIAEHRPRSHQAHLEWTPSRMVHWAESIGPYTARLFERILADKPHPRWAIRLVWESSGLPGSTQ